MGGVRAAIVTIVGIILTYFLRNLIGSDPRYTVTFGFILSLIVGGALFGWAQFTSHRARAFITDRRFVRLEVSFPAFMARRSLFWNEVLKVKTFAPNLLFRYLKIGTLVVQPIMSESGQEDVSFKHVYYYGDLGNYMDKILYTFKTKPEEVKQLRPFVAKPAGERY